MTQTLYEIAIEKDGCTHGTDNRWLLAYASNTPSRRRIAACLRKRWERVEKITGPVANWDFGPEKAPGTLHANGYTIRYTGRTRREAQTSELTYIGEVK